MPSKLTPFEIDTMFPDFSIKQRKIIGLQDDLLPIINKMQGNRIWNSNGKTWDATAANIQVAINDLPASGGEVYVPPGTYTFTTSSITAVSNLHLVGVPGATVFYTAGTDSYWTGGLHGLVEIANKNNVTIEGIKFDADSKGHWIKNLGSDNLKIVNCEFTGDGDAADGQLVFWGYTGSTANMNNTKILNCYFHDITAAYPIRFYPRTYTIEHTEIAGCRFEDCWSPAILIDAYGIIRDTKIHHNDFIDQVATTGAATPSAYSAAVHAGLAVTNQVFDADIHHNYYKNTRTGQNPDGFAFIYSSENTRITNNTLISTAGVDGIAIAPGRTTTPDTYMVIDNNYIKGFGNWIDLDCSHKLSITNNNVIECGVALLTGYYTQEHIQVNNNRFVNCMNSAFPGLMVLGNSNPLKADIYDNQFIDTRAVPDTTHCVFLTGVSGEDFSDVAIRRNRFYMPNKAFTGFLATEGTGTPPVPPTMILENDVEDSTGLVFPDQGNIIKTTGGVYFGTSWANVDTTNYKVDLPTAGSYIIYGTFRTIHDGDISAYGRIRLYNNTDSAAVTNSDRLLIEIVETTQGNINVLAGPMWQITVTDAKTIYLQGISLQATTIGIQCDANGYNEFGYFKLK